MTTVTGPAVREPKNLRVRIGTPVKNLIDICGGYNGVPAKMIMGGPMMGIAVASDDVPVLQGTSGVLALGAAANVIVERDCIRCGMCIRACPMNLAPQHLNNLTRRRRFADAKAAYVLDCIECGCCAYVCPAKIRLVHNFKYAKSEIAVLERRS